MGERRSQVNKRKLCFICIRKNHAATMCKTSTRCKVCNDKGHHTFLHLDVVNNSTVETMNTSSSINHCSPHNVQDVVLSTAVVFVKDFSGRFHECRCLLDPGSQLNLLSYMCRRLNLKLGKTKISVLRVAGACNTILQTADITIKSLNSSYQTNILCYVTERPTSNVPINSFKIKRIEIPEDISLADPKFNINGSIDLILNARIFWKILGSERLQLPDTDIYLIETKL